MTWFKAFWVIASLGWTYIMSLRTVSTTRYESGLAIIICTRNSITSTVTDRLKIDHHPYSLCYHLKLILFFVYRGFPTKLVLYSWWIFLVFLVSSYTANLAAVFTTNMLDSEIESIQDLFSSPKIKFGTITGGAFNALKVYIYLYQYFWLQQGLKICKSVFVYLFSALSLSRVLNV